MDRLSGMEVFVRVVETGSFSKVARELGASQPTISRHIAELEARLGSELLHRTTRRVTPTEAGRAFYERARRILSELSDAEADARGASSLSGGLRLAAPTGFGRRFVLPAVLSFMERHASVTFDLLFNDRLIDLVDEGVDLAIRIGMPSDSSVLARRLGESRLLAVASPAYLVRHGTPKTVFELADHDVVLIRSSSGLQNRWPVPIPGAPPGGVVAKGRLVADDVEAICQAVVQGAGCSVLPYWTVAEALKKRQLREILKEAPLPATPILGVYPPTRPLSSRGRAFLDHLQESLGKTGFFGGGSSMLPVR